MAQQGERDLDRDLPLGDEDTRGMGDEDFDEAVEGDESDLEDEDEFDDELTGEVGSEGGSPGETERVRKPR